MIGKKLAEEERFKIEMPLAAMIGKKLAEEELSTEMPVAAVIGKQLKLKARRVEGMMLLPLQQIVAATISVGPCRCSLASKAVFVGHPGRAVAR